MAALPFNFETPDGDNLIDPGNGNGSDILETYTLAGYTGDLPNCTSSRREGDTCTITNTKIPDGTLIVKKVLVNDDNGIRRRLGQVQVHG